MLSKRIALVFVALIAFGCGDKPELQETPEGAFAQGNGGINGPAPGMSMFIEPAEAMPIQAEATWSVPLRVRLKDANYVGVPNQSVTFQIKASPGDASTLSALTAVTDEAGSASVDLRLGPLSGDAIVTVSHPESAPLDMYVTVGEATTGTMRVDIHDPGNAPVELAPYRVQFFEQTTFDCSQYVPRRSAAEALMEVHVADTTQPAVQSGFGPNTQFTAVAEALGQGGMTLAGGCIDGLTVNPGETKVVDVWLAMVPIAPSGTYEVESTWDISEAIASQNGTAGAMIRVIEFMANPGQAIYDIVLEEVEDAVGFGLDLLLDIAGIKDRMIDYINEQLNRSASVQTFSAISADLSTMLNTLNVSSQLTIAKTDNDFNFTGHEEWTSVEVSWTWRCAQSQTAGCETHEVDLTNNGGAAGAVSYDWTGQVQTYDHLVIESHQAQIDIGRLQLFLLEQVILPDITNGQANSIAEAIVYWIDCNALASRALQGAEVCDPTGFFCAGEDEAAIACEFALGELADYVTQPLEGLTSNLDIELAGTAKLVDGDSNGITDQIDDGNTTGQLSGSSEPVVVEWSAVTAQ